MYVPCWLSLALFVETESQGLPLAVSERNHCSYLVTFSHGASTRAGGQGISVAARCGPLRYPLDMRSRFRRFPDGLGTSPS